MFKRFVPVIFLLALLAGPSWGLDSSYDPYHLYPLIDNSDSTNAYARYGNSDIGFYYQLRDITGASRQDVVAGPQWFATIYENYYYYFHHPSDSEHAGIYRRTMGGEIPEVDISLVGDILNGFDYVLAEEPQPYARWVDRNLINTSMYDVYPDPLESLCLVLTNGQGEFNLDFGNPYARHFPFWYGWGSGSTMRWWQNYTYNSINEPIAFIVDTSTQSIYKKQSTARSASYPIAYTYTISGDNLTVKDTANNTVYTISGDRTAAHYVLDADGNNAYYVSGDVIFDANNNYTWVYTIEDGDTANVKYICDLRSVNESVSFSGFDDAYTFTVNPSAEQLINPAAYLNANIRLRGMDSGTYGSKLGYMTLRQRADLATGYSNYREFTTIPMVIANVSNGNASTNPLYFDMIVFNSGDVVNRIKYTWDAQSDMTQDLGIFYMMQPYNSSTPTYDLETRITNRTGTRYELFRYDQIPARSSSTVRPAVEYRDNYASIQPDYWKYDLTPDLYGTLPTSFMLDAHSQIAPGLVTVYRNNIGSGYGTINTNYDTSESFRIYEYSSANPKNLRLNYKRVAGITLDEDETRNRLSLSGGSVETLGFNMRFADVVRDDDETEYELENLMGKPPLMMPVNSAKVIPAQYYVNSSALNSFTINKPLAEYLDESYLSRVYNFVTSKDEKSNDVTIDLATHTAIQPVAIRFRIPRQNQLLVNRWAQLDNASNSRELFERFSNFGTVWVRSEAMKDKDKNLLLTVNEKGSDKNVSAGDCVRAFTYNDELYLEFIVFIADSKSRKSTQGAYIELFKDDNIPYILIGDGVNDGIINLQFYIGANTDNPTTRDNTTSNDNQPVSNGEGSGGGGGCNLGFAGILGLVILAGIMRKR
ncbi:MAG: hypothetical protein IJU48_09860 [Synergistaceae bacterium]|nr:hypothetical protein [Synergistaceae bacterium]